MSWFKNYINKQKNCLDFISKKDFQKLVLLINYARQHGQTIYIIGNGGSLANSSHAVEDLAGVASNAIQKKNPGAKRIRAVCLNDAAYITAIANDYSYEEIFSKQLESVLNPGDIIIGLSVSGTSRNVIRAFEYASKIGARTFALTSVLAKDKPDSLVQIADNSVVFNTKDFGVAEDCFMTLLHAAAYWFCES